MADHAELITSTATLAAAERQLFVANIKARSSKREDVVQVGRHADHDAPYDMRRVGALSVYGWLTHSTGGKQLSSRTVLQLDTNGKRCRLDIDRTPRPACMLSPKDRCAH
jgi:hypothetical protein